MLRFLDPPRSCRGLLVLWLITHRRVRLFFVARSNVAQTLAGRQATPETIALINAPARARPADLRSTGSFLWQRAAAATSATTTTSSRRSPRSSRHALPKTVSLALGAAVIWLLLGVLNGVHLRGPPALARRPRH